MSITDELRKEARGLGGYVYTREQAEHLTAIADRIDAEHKKACDDAWDNGYEADYLGIEKWLTEHPQVMEHHGWIRLPKDADGEYIHVGDVMELVSYDEDDRPVIRTVDAVGEQVFFAWSKENGRYAQYEAHAYRHYHAPTVEDVLREFGKAWVEWEDGSPHDPIAEYAAKLRLAGDAE